MTGDEVELLALERMTSHGFFLSSAHTVHAGEEGVPRTLLFWGCEEGWSLIFSCNFCNIDDSRGLHHGGDRTIQVPARCSPSSYRS